MLLVLLLVKHGEKVLPAAARCCNHSTVGDGVPVHHEYVGICAQGVNQFKKGIIFAGGVFL